MLVVEDEAPIRHLVTSFLDGEGFEVLQAADGQEALAVIGATCPDVVLLDLWMPRMDGWAFLHEIDRLAAMDEVPIVVTSAARWMPSGPRVKANLSKPFELDELLSAIQRAMRPETPSTS